MTMTRRKEVKKTDRRPSREERLFRVLKELIQELGDKLTRLVRVVQMQSNVIRSLITVEAQMNQELQDALNELAGEVSRNTDVDTSANLLLTRLTAKIEELAAGMDPAAAAKVREFAAGLRASTDALVAGVTANTPAETPPEPTE